MIKDQKHNQKPDQKNNSRRDLGSINKFFKRKNDEEKAGLDKKQLKLEKILEKP